MSPPTPLPLPLYGQAALAVTAHPLTPEAFAPFGDVVQNPRPDVHPSQLADAGPAMSSSLSPPSLLPHDAVSANQGSAIKYQHVTRPQNHYDDCAPSGVPGAAVVNMFVCAARQLRKEDDDYYFDVHILERHPFTTQTFTPLSTTSSGGLPSSPSPSSSPARSNSTGSYLVIVAPTQQQQQGTQATAAAAVENPPDLAQIKAFVATTNQAVTYGAGTWHAPMVALGPNGSTVDFVVTQFANGVADEDCQEVTFGDPGHGGSVHVRVVPTTSFLEAKPNNTKSRL